MELRTLNDWVVIPRLLRAGGVADVANFGGYAKQFTVTLNPPQLERYGLTINDVVEAVQKNNANAGGSVLSRGSQSFVIRGRGALQNERDLPFVSRFLQRAVAHPSNKSPKETANHVQGFNDNCHC